MNEVALILLEKILYMLSNYNQFATTINTIVGVLGAVVGIGGIVVGIIGIKKASVVIQANFNIDKVVIGNFETKAETDLNDSEKEELDVAIESVMSEVNMTSNVIRMEEELFPNMIEYYFIPEGEEGELDKFEAIECEDEEKLKRLKDAKKEEEKEEDDSDLALK